MFPLPPTATSRPRGPQQKKLGKSARRNRALICLFLHGNLRAGGGSSGAICLPPPARSSSRGGGVACLDAPRFGVGACGAWSVGGARAVCRRLPSPTPCLWGVGPSPRTRHVFPQRAPARWSSPAAGVARCGVVRVATLGSPRRTPLKRLGGSTVENLKMT